MSRTYKLRKFVNGKNKAGEEFINWSLTVPQNIADAICSQMGEDVLFRVELTDEGILFTPADPADEPVELPAWADKPVARAKAPTKTPAKKTAAAKKAPTRKTAAKTPAKKTTARKTTTAKAPTKAPAKKTATARKPAAKKTAARKTATPKAPAKRTTTARKTTTAKPAAKRPVARRKAAA